MLIAQITDLHLGFGQKARPAKDADVVGRDRLVAVLEAVRNLRERPALLLATGDLVESTSPWAYPVLRDCLEEVLGDTVRVALALGNHDHRAAFDATFGLAGGAGGFHQYVVDTDPVRVVVLDSLRPGYHGGAFCETRAGWLDAALEQGPARPTLLALHHPPMPSGIPWLSESADTPWIRCLQAVVERHPHVVQILCGHIHTPIQARFAGRSVSVGAAVAPALAVETAAIDPHTPDGRPMILDTPPGWTLHQWRGGSMSGGLDGHFASFPQTLAAPLVRFTPDFAELPLEALDLNKPA